MIKIFNLILLFLAVSATALAAPSVRYRYMKNSQGYYQLAISGSGLCDSTKFRIRVTNLNSGDTDWYKSGSGNTEWKIQSCRLDPMMLNAKVMMPGHILQVRTYAADGHKTHTFQKTIPCDESQWGNAFADGDIYDGSEALYETCGSSPQPAPQPAPLTCSYSVRVNSQNSETADLKVSCSENIAVAVAVYAKANGQVLCANNRFAANENSYVACNFYRPRTTRLDYSVRVNELNSGVLLVNDSGVIYKDATYNFAPQGTVTSDLNLRPMAQKKALGRGIYWSVKVKAQVSDADVDPSEGQRLIKVEAIVSNSKGTKVLATSQGNSGEVVEFDLEHQYVKPLMFGQPHETEEGFVRGENKIVIRVYDAYNGTTFIDLAPVSVNIQE